MRCEQRALAGHRRCAIARLNCAAICRSSAARPGVVAHRDLAAGPRVAAIEAGTGRRAGGGGGAGSGWRWRGRRHGLGRSAAGRPDRLERAGVSGSPAGAPTRASVASGMMIASALVSSQDVAAAVGRGLDRIADVGGQGPPPADHRDPRRQVERQRAGAVIVPISSSWLLSIGASIRTDASRPRAGRTPPGRCREAAAARRNSSRLIRS